jgi:hypothetical protein
MRGMTVFGLVAGPIGSLVATTLWTAGRYGGCERNGARAGHAVVGLRAGRVARTDPAGRASAGHRCWLLLFGVTGGMAFGFQGFFAADAEESLTALDAYPLESALLLWIPGPFMPSALLLLAILLAARRLVPLWTPACFPPGP